MEMNYWIMLDVLSLCLLVICLYKIKDAVKYIEKRVSDKSTPAVLYLREKDFIRGIKILMIAIIIWSIREVLNFADELLGYDLGLFIGFLGIFTAIFLSYGLYTLVVTFRAKFRVSEGKKG